MTDAESDRDDAPLPDRIASLLREAEDICRAEPAASFENVWHTLLLLEMEPVERLNVSLMRGRSASVRP
ncbi:MAG: hypothetical protein NTV05_07000 [Acidobacteria bacterium]|nr:hypothetical protein [Acidobacteriota bacterium]